MALRHTSRILMTVPPVMQADSPGPDVLLDVDGRVSSRAGELYLAAQSQRLGVSTDVKG